MSRNAVPGLGSVAYAVKRQLKKAKVFGHRKYDGGVGPSADFLSAAAAAAAATEDKDYFRLSEGEFGVMTDRLDDLQAMHVKMIQEFERFAWTICVFGISGIPKGRDIDAMNRLATAHAARASEALNLLAELQGVLVGRELLTNCCAS